MNSLLLSILALAIPAAKACLTISGSCQSGSIDPYVSINANDNNQASGHTSCSNFAHCDMQISGAVNSAWVENCQYLHWNTGHGNYVIDMHPSTTTTCTRTCGATGACCDFETQYLVDTRAFC
ncbi:hypothetical protein GGI35DRAFT_461689 [Trichoderma velutinum]